VFAALGAIVVNYAKTFFTSWVFGTILAVHAWRMFILVTLLLPQGHRRTVHSCWEAVAGGAQIAAAESAAR